LSLTATVSGGSTRLSFRTLAGYNYQVEYKSNLTDANWNPLGSPISGNGSVQWFNDPLTTGQGCRFYRVLIE